MKKTFAMLLCLTMLLGLLPATPALAQSHSYDSLFYTVENGNAVIIDCNVEYGDDLIIPDALDGYPVTAISESAFIQCSGFGKVIIGQNVTSIAPTALDECTIENGIWVDEKNPAYSSDEFGVLFNKDKTLLIKAPRMLNDGYTIPDTVKTIGRHAFRWCKNLTEVTLPEGVTHIEERAFFNCASLSQISIPDSVEKIGLFAFSMSNALVFTQYNNGIYLGNEVNPYHTFVNPVDNSVTAFSFHADTKIIVGGAFYNCNGLIQLTVPEGVVSIGERAFDCSTDLTQISLPDSLQHIGYGAFSSCYALTEIRIGANASEIEPGAFDSCTGLNGIWVDPDNTAYCSDEQGVLYNKEKTLLLRAPCTISGCYTVAQGVTVIEKSAFNKCRSLSEVILPDTVTEIGESAFSNSSVTAVNIPDGVTHIGTFAFYSSKLSAVRIPDSVTTIGDGVFYSCMNLKEAILPQGLTEIPQWMFLSCGRLTQISIPSSVTTIGYCAFESCSNLAQLTLPEGVTTIGRSAFSRCTALTTVSLPESIVDIGLGAFGGCRNLEYNHTWRGPGEYLGSAENPFFALMGVTDTDIESFTIPEETKVLAAGAFSTCECMKTIQLPDGLVAIGDQAFHDCATLAEIEIPDTVTFIGDEAFADCKLTEIVIPNSVTYMGEGVFSECAKLEAIRFCGEAPIMDPWVFNQTTTNVYCHQSFESWAKHIGRNYLGTINWADGHVFLDYLPDEGFRCPTGGTKTATCEGCSATDTVTVSEPAEHRYEMGKCTVCGEIDPQSCFLTGTLSSANDSSALLTLLQSGEQITTLTVTGNTYLWDGLQPGDYTLTVEKEDHVTYRVDLTLKPGENKLDLTLCRPGDVVGIGDLNIGDVATIYSHVRGRSQLTGYTKDCADLSGDGRINLGDVTRLYSKIRN